MADAFGAASHRQLSLFVCLTLIFCLYHMYLGVLRVG